MTFRNSAPIRRTNRTACKHYNSYKKNLRDDFNKRCGYCDDSDLIRITSFTIDHFIPQNPVGFTHAIEPNDYANLVYSCRYCNSSKTNKWPTNDPAIPNNGTVGFMDPVDTQYSTLFSRCHKGRISPTPGNALATYIYDEIKLWLPIHERMWKLERLRSLDEQLELQIQATTDPDDKANLEAIHYRLLKLLKGSLNKVLLANE